MNKTSETQATIISIKNGEFVNPMGSPLAGTSRSGVSLSMGSTGEIYEVTFQLADETLLRTKVGGRALRKYAVGQHGTLKYHAGTIKKWTPNKK